MATFSFLSRPVMARAPGVLAEMPANAGGSLHSSHWICDIYCIHSHACQITGVCAGKSISRHPLKRPLLLLAVSPVALSGIFNLTNHQLCAFQAYKTASAQRQAGEQLTPHQLLSNRNAIPVQCSAFQLLSFLLKLLKPLRNWDWGPHRRGGERCYVTYVQFALNTQGQAAKPWVSLMSARFRSEI